MGRIAALSMAFESAADEIVASYRELARMLREAPEGSPEAAALEDRIGLLRAEYLALGREAESADEPLAPSLWPEDETDTDPRS